MKREPWEWRVLGAATGAVVLAVALFWWDIIGRVALAVVCIAYAALVGALTFRPDSPREQQREARHRRQVKR